MSTENNNDGNATETAIENEDGNVNAESTTKDDTDYKAKYDKVVADNQKLAMSVEEKTLKSKTKIRKALDGMDEADLKELGYVSSETSEQRSARVAKEATDAEKATSQKALQATQAAAMGLAGATLQSVLIASGGNENAVQGSLAGFVAELELDIEKGKFKTKSGKSLSEYASEIKENEAYGYMFENQAAHTVVQPTTPGNAATSTDGGSVPTMPLDKFEQLTKEKQNEFTAKGGVFG